MVNLRNRIFLQIIMLALAAVWLLPVIGAVKASFNVRGWDNYQKVLSFKINGSYFLPKMFLNSVMVVGTSILLITAVTMLAAFAFSKMNFRGRNVLYLSVLGFFAIPVITILQPVTTILSNMGLRNTYASMILPMVTINIPIALLIFRNYIDGISNTYMEAAMLDGCSKFQIFTKIILPMSAPALVNVLIVLFLNGWNDYVIPLMFNSKQSLFMLTLAPGFFSTSMFKSDIGALYACIIIIAIPTLLVYLFLQRYIIQGLTAGGIKG